MRQPPAEKAFISLVVDTELFIKGMDTLMRTPHSFERGKSIASLMNTFETIKDQHKLNSELYIWNHKRGIHMKPKAKQSAAKLQKEGDSGK